MQSSICIATYNGEKYISEQLSSILKQINKNDEIIIINDCSTDNTLMLIEQIHDIRIKIYNNIKNKGHVYSFSKAIGLANNEIIFLSDQDDIWVENRFNIMKDKLIKSNSSLLTSNFSTFNYIYKSDYVFKDNLNPVQESESFCNIKNIIKIFLGKISYYGCCMVIKHDIKEIIYPIPKYIESHDIWIALIANLLGKNLHINDMSLFRRIHDNNVSVKSKRKILKILKTRVIFSISIFNILYRIIIMKIRKIL
ncbi:glycosyltransferase [Sulfurimonas sp.]|uniref:glycosyltransferase n=1 Tax=Sulfurimonas sp. TaxID=2022749 RepID=UPI0025DDFDA2|nr:glycosyltransferase [Sulfurimonas sp.]